VVSSATGIASAARIRPKLGSDDWIMRGCLFLLGLFLLVAIVLPL